VEAEVMEQGGSGEQEREPDAMVPEHLRELYRQGCEELDGEHEEGLAKLLMEFQDVFAIDDLDMGKTGLIQHKIDTAGAHPIKQRLRRIPLHMKGVVKEEMKKLLSKGLLEPSMSL
jgi:hypothetical protein